MQIPGFRGMSFITVMRRAVVDFVEDDLLTYAAALAFHVLFAIFPFLVFLTALLGFLQISDFFEWLLLQAHYVLPQEAMAQVEYVVGEIREEQGGLLSFGIIVAIWSASTGMRAMMHAMNVAYNVTEARPTWKRYLLSIMYTIGLALMLIIAAGMMLLGPRTMSWLATYIGMDRFIVSVWRWLRWPVSVWLLLMVVALAYYLTPNVDMPFRLVTPGSFIAVGAWVTASLGFGYYITTFANYSATYGSLGAVIVLLLFFYLSSAVLLFGAEVNAVIDLLSRNTSAQQHTIQGAC